MKYTKANPPLVCMQTQSKCYRQTCKMEVLGVLWHSTAANNPRISRYVQPSDDAPDREQMLAILGKNAYNNDWNHAQVDAGLNCWIGKLADESVTTVQSMPWDFRPWGCGPGTRGSCNTGWVQFEICEADLADKAYFAEVFEEGCQITAYICQLYGVDPQGAVRVSGVDIPTILCHADSHALGFGSNHGDIYHWFKYHNKSMQDVRNRVEAILNEDSSGSTGAYTPIMGKAVATAAQMWSYIQSVAVPTPYGVASLVNIYLEEGAAEGVRGDIAFAQSCLETGNFLFRGSAVTFDQNNFCGMGVTSNGMKGASFADAREGIRAQIQHLKAYACSEPLNQELVDPRFKYVTRGSSPYVEWLGQQENPQGYGWATGAGYGEKILAILNKIIGVKADDEEEEDEMAAPRYNAISDCPGYAKPTITKMVDKGFIGGTGTGKKDAEGRPADLSLSLDMIRVFVVMDRAGSFD